MSWVNFGGGHHITREDYNTDHLIQILNDFKSCYPHLTVILEPGEAIGWQTGFLRSKVLDVTYNKTPIAILDVSFTAHMPDCLEMPYRPEVRGAGKKNEKAWNCILGGTTCLSGDFLADYSFDKPLQTNDTIIFEDMIHYTMVKTSFFNGVKHPAIGLIKESNEFKLLRDFNHQDYKSRLGSHNR